VCYSCQQELFVLKVAIKTLVDTLQETVTQSIGMLEFSRCNFFLSVVIVGSTKPRQQV
jgi:hypothetical protein